MEKKTVVISIYYGYLRIKIRVSTTAICRAYCSVLVFTLLVFLNYRFKLSIKQMQFIIRYILILVYWFKQKNLFNIIIMNKLFLQCTDY